MSRRALEPQVLAPVSAMSTPCFCPTTPISRRTFAASRSTSWPATRAVRRPARERREIFTVVSAGAVRAEQAEHLPTGR